MDYEDECDVAWLTVKRLFKNLVSGGLVLRWQGDDIYTFIHDDMNFGFTKFELRKLEHEYNVKLQLTY